MKNVVVFCCVATLKHVARTVAHVELSDHLVDVVFVLFDENGQWQHLVVSVTMIRDHSFPLNVEFWTEPQSSSVSNKILWNSILANDKGTNTAYFGRFHAAVDN